MASKIESTAVNELIELVQSGQQPVKDPDDLMFAPPKPAAAVKQTRMTATVPPVKGAGEVAPLPRQRAPQSTQTMTSMPPAVRVSTAPPARAVSIPPLNAPANETMRAAVPPVGSDTLRTTGPLAGETMRAIAPPPTPARRPSLPPPVRKSGTAAEGTPAPERLPSLPSLLTGQARGLSPTPPTNAPVAAPFEAPLTLDPAESNPLMHIPQAPPAPVDMTSNAAWFEPSRPVDHVEDENWVGTSIVQKQVPLKPLLGKLVVPTTLLVIAGVFIGGYFAFNGEGGKPRAEAAKTEPKAQAPAAPTAPAALAAAEAKLAGEEPKAAEPAPAAPAAAEPAKAEPAVAAPVAEPAKAEPAKAAPSGPSDTDLAKLAAAEPVKTEPAKTEPAKAEPAVAQPAKTEPAPVTPPNLVTSEPGHAAPAIAKQPTLVDVRIDSNPSGATVMLVDRGKTSFLGTTPVSAAVDPSRQYDLVFTFENKPTQIEHLDPKNTKHIAITLGKHGSSAVTETPKHHEETPAPRHTETPKAEKPKAKLVEPAFEAKTETKPEPKKAAPPVPSGDGTLMISSKPPCEIYVDGKSTGLTTPQRSIALPAGTHKVTLVNNEKSIKKTVAVQITANKTEKVIQDLMK